MSTSQRVGLYIDSAFGNVGIGRTDPKFGLEVKGDVKLNTMEMKKFDEGSYNTNSWVTKSTVDNDWKSVCWSPQLGLLCAVAEVGSGRVMISSDGSSWVTKASGSSSAWQSVCWSREKYLFCAVANTGAVTGNWITISSDGLTWQSQNNPADNSWNSVCWSPELSLFCAVASSGTGNRVMVSSDGNTWVTKSSAANNSWQEVCWASGLGIFCAVASSGTGNRVMTSSNGSTWVTQQSAGDYLWYSVCWSPELYLLCAVAIYTGGTSGAGKLVMTSSDGITWVTRATPINNDWVSVCWASELSIFCALANYSTLANNYIMISSDGITWTSKRTSVPNNVWQSICWAPEIGIFCTVANTGTGTRVMNTLASNYRQNYPLIINNAGFLGIGTTTPTTALTVNGTLSTSETLNVQGNANISGTIDAAFPYAIIEEQQAAGTAGGDAVAPWTTRPLNTVVADTIGISLSSSQITLPAGTYTIYATSPAYYVNRNKTVLYNVTLGRVDGLGTATWASASTNNVYSRSIIQTIVSNTSSTVYEIRHFFQTGNTGDGLGLATLNSGFVEVYTRVVITKIA